MIIELVGGQFVNQGAALMVRAVRDRVQRAIPSAKFAMAPGPWAPASECRLAGILRKFPLRKRRVDLNRWSYGWPRSVCQFLVDRDLVLEGNVDAVLDLSGYAYGDRWGALSLEAPSARLERARRYSRPYVFLPQAFGPFDGLPPRIVRRFGESLAQSSFVAARDAESMAALQAVCPSGARILRIPDLTIGYPGELSAGAEVGVNRDTALIIPNIRMFDSGSAGLGWREGYVPLLQQLGTELRRRGFVPRVLNHSGREDRALAESLGVPNLIEESDPMRTKGIIGAAGMVISSRYHGCVSALSQGVPCLATSWSHKYQELFEDFGQRDSVVTVPDLAVAIGQLDHLVAQRRDVSEQIRQSANAQAVLVEAMWDEVITILQCAGAR